MKHTVLVVFVIGVLGNALIKPGGIEAKAVPEVASARVYARHCASCHGRNGRAQTVKAKRNHARNLVDPRWQERVSDERIFNAIMNGKGKMPGFGKKLSEQQIDALVTYVRSLR